MNRRHPLLLVLLALGWALPAFAADPAPAAGAAAPAAVASRLGDPDHLLADAAVRDFTAKLDDLARTPGLKLRVELRAKFTPKTPGQRPGNVAAGIGRDLNLTSDDVLAVYFADTDKWGLWIGDNHVNRFVGRPGTVKQLTKDGTFHHAKLDFIAAAQARGVELANAAARTGPVSDARKIQFQAAAVIEGFTAKLAPPPAP